MSPSSWVPPQPLPERPRVFQSADLISELERRDKDLVTFLGFGELGYEDVEAMRALVRQELGNHSRDRTVVNTGTIITTGFHTGIAEVYREAKAMGFETTGIHPSVALRDRSRYRLSPFVDETFFVEDDSWGGYLAGSREPSPTLRVLVAVSAEVLAIGGGRHTADELSEFLRQEVPVRFFEAEMNHGVAVWWYRTRGVVNIDFRGEARQLWQEERKSKLGRAP